MFTLLAILFVPRHAAVFPKQESAIERRIDGLLARMTLQDKLGQMSQETLPDHADAKLIQDIENGRYGSLYGWGSSEVRSQFQSAARHSKLGIPIVFGDDVIHGYSTGFPIPLGQAASFDPELVQASSRVAAKEATSAGVQWAFSPMMDIARDPRWGRIAEGYGEDPCLASVMAVATMKGYQGRSLSDSDSMAACGKHYVGYGASEAGRDYNSTWIPEILLRDVYLRPFQACAAAGIASFMSAFNAYNGVPASGNAFALRQVLRNEWGFKGMVVSDYAAIAEMIKHGYAADGEDAARKAMNAGVDMEMVSKEYWRYGAKLVADHKVDPRLIDDSVRNILSMKFKLGLFDGRTQPPSGTLEPTPETFDLSKRMAEESFVLLKNENSTLPLSTAVQKVALIGPLADRPTDQLGSWAHASPKTSITLLAALRARLGAENVLYAPGVSFTFDKNKNFKQNEYDLLNSMDKSGFPEAIQAAQQADVVVLALGEPSFASGEASSRSNLDLPGPQEQLVAAIAALGKPVIGVVMAGRPLTMSAATAKMNALLYTWHSGPMAGPAIVETLFGDCVPSGKLPVTFPRSVGQVPIYYDHLSTGRPEEAGGDDPYTSRYLDIQSTPEYPFGYGLSYTTFNYSATRVQATEQGFQVSADVANTGKIDADEIVQLYIHEKAASVARPVRELKGFRRVHLRAGESKTVSFLLKRADLAFWNPQMRFEAEPGAFEAWIAPDSQSGVAVAFNLN